MALLIAAVVGATFFVETGIVGVFLGAFAYLISVLIHEIGHTLVARHYGIQVLRIKLSFLGGFAELEDEPPSSRAGAAVAVAGPAATLAVAGVSYGIAEIFEAASVTMAPVMFWVARVNLFLAVFNLLPGLPLDGGRILSALFWKRTGNRVAGVAAGGRGGQVVGMMLIAAGIVAPFTGGPFSPLVAVLGYWLLTTSSAIGRAARLELFDVTVAVGFEPAEVVDAAAVVADAGGWQPWVLMSASPGVYSVIERRKLAASDSQAVLSSLASPAAAVQITHPLAEAVHGTHPVVVIGGDGRAVGVATPATLRAAARRI